MDLELSDHCHISGRHDYSNTKSRGPKVRSDVQTSYRTKTEVHKFFCCLTRSAIQMTPHERHGVSNHWQLLCLLNNLFKPYSKTTSKVCITGPLWGDDFPHKRPVSRKCFHVILLSWLYFGVCTSMLNSFNSEIPFPLTQQAPDTRHFVHFCLWNMQCYYKS